MRSRVAAPVAGLLALLVGCAAPQTSGPSTDATPSPPAATSASASPAATPAPTSAASAPTTSAPATTAPKVPASLKFTSQTVDGKSFDGAQLAGKPVLLWFWAPWCPTCRRQLPTVTDIAATYGDRVHVVGVGSLDSGTAIKRFASDAKGMTHLQDEQGKVWKHFAVVEQSSFVLLDRSGTKVFSAGYGGSNELTAQVAKVAG